MSTDKSKSSRYSKRRKFSKRGELDISDFDFKPMHNEGQVKEDLLEGDDYKYNEGIVTDTSRETKSDVSDYCETQSGQLNDVTEEKRFIAGKQDSGEEIVKDTIREKRRKLWKKEQESDDKTEMLVGDIANEQNEEKEDRRFKYIYTSMEEGEEDLKKEEEKDECKQDEEGLEYFSFDAYEENVDYNKYNQKYKLDKEIDILKDYSENDLPIIELMNVSKSYQEGIDAVVDVNFRINNGEFVFIVGKSGSGKSTLIKLFTREIRPTKGKIYVNGREITKLQNRKIAKFRRSIGVVFQDFKLLMDRSVFENVAFAQRVIEKSTEEINRRVPEILSVVGLLDKKDAFPHELSGGEQQRVALARALVNEPTILLADEPTGNLDPKTAWEIMELLDEINQKGTTVIVVTHNVDIVDAMQKRVIAIDKGLIVSDEEKGGYLHES